MVSKNRINNLNKSFISWQKDSIKWKDKQKLSTDAIMMDVYRLEREDATLYYAANN